MSATMHANAVREGMNIKYRRKLNSKGAAQYGPVERGEVWSPGPVGASWWVKPETDPNHPVVVRVAELVGPA